MTYSNPFSLPFSLMLLLMAEPKSSFVPDSINLAFSFVIKSSLSNANCTISA